MPIDFLTMYDRGIIMKKSLRYFAVLTAFVITIAIFFAVQSGADTVKSEQLVNILFDSVKALDSERYMGKEFEKLCLVTEEQKAELKEEYTALLYSLYEGDAMVDRSLSVFDRVKALETPTNLRSVDLVCLDYKVNSFEVADSLAKLNVTWNSCEKLIVKNEGPVYVAGFPLSQNTMEAVFVKTEEGWKVRDTNLQDNVLGEEDLSLKKEFSSFDLAYDYAMNATPTIPDTLSLEK